MNTQILYPEKVTALRIGNEAKITITAMGHEEGMQNIRIEKSMATIFPPIYMVVGEPSAAIGYFPYKVTLTVPLSTDADYIFFSMADGDQKIPIYDVMQEHKDATPEAVLNASASNSDQVVGYAYNSTDINKAIADAVSKLQKKYPGNVSAKLVESGFVGIGTPVGIAYYYAVMEQS